MMMMMTMDICKAHNVSNHKWLKRHRPSLDGITSIILMNFHVNFSFVSPALHSASHNCSLHDDCLSQYEIVGLRVIIDCLNYVNRRCPGGLFQSSSETAVIISLASALLSIRVICENKEILTNHINHVKI